MTKKLFFPFLISFLFLSLETHQSKPQSAETRNSSVKNLAKWGQIVLGRKRATIRTDIFAPSSHLAMAEIGRLDLHRARGKCETLFLFRRPWLVLHAADDHPSTSTSTTGALWSPNKAVVTALPISRLLFPSAVTGLPPAFIRTGPGHLTGTMLDCGWECKSRTGSLTRFKYTPGPPPNIWGLRSAPPIHRRFHLPFPATSCCRSPWTTPARLVRLRHR